MARTVAKVLKAAPIRPPKAVEMDARNRLMEMARAVQLDALSIVEAIEGGNIGPLQTANAIQEMLDKWEGMDSRSMAAAWVKATDDMTRNMASMRKWHYCM